MGILRIGDVKTTTRIMDSYYVIGWEQQEILYVPPKVKGKQGTKEYRMKPVFWKSDRYSSYAGNLQVEYNPEQGCHWKTYKGAAKALERIKANDRTKRTKDAIVLRYNRNEIVQQFLIPADSE